MIFFACEQGTSFPQQIHGENSASLAHSGRNLRVVLPAADLQQEINKSVNHSTSVSIDEISSVLFFTLIQHTEEQAHAASNSLQQMMSIRAEYFNVNANMIDTHRRPPSSTQKLHIRRRPTHTKRRCPSSSAWPNKRRKLQLQHRDLNEYQSAAVGTLEHPRPTCST